MEPPMAILICSGRQFLKDELQAEKAADFRALRLSPRFEKATLKGSQHCVASWYFV